MINNLQKTVCATTSFNKSKNCACVILKKNEKISLSDRCVFSCERFLTFDENKTSKALLPDNLHSDGVITVNGEGFIRVLFSGENGSYQLRIKFSNRCKANGVGARIRLHGWQAINYIGIGYTWEGVYEHVKVSNPIIDQWFDLLVGHADLAWGWRNNWDHPDDREMHDIRLYIKGTPGETTYLDVSEMVLWQEDHSGLTDLLGRHHQVPRSVLDAIRTYERKCFRCYKEQAREYLESGRCPLYGEIMLDWPVNATIPPSLTETGTYQFSWHALHPATMLMLYAQDISDPAPVFAARDFVNGWIERSFFQVDQNLKYAWYDHGTAERCLAMVQLYADGQNYGFDYRFMTRLREVIFRHAQLLASEVFYAGHQPTRYHNHAWFQDLVLLAVTLAFPDWPCARDWADVALWRLEDQLSQLICCDNGYAVFVENSIGYHHGIQRIVEFAGELATLSGRDTPIPVIAKELQKFSEFFRYPDSRRTVSQGDTFRMPNLLEPNLRGQIPYGAPDVTILSKAGYAIIKADHDGRPFMLTMLATSLSRTHKHEDNLSITLYFDGVEWLIDPSFYSHEYSESVPRYLRSAAAHNVVFIPNKVYNINPKIAQIYGMLESNKFCLIGSHNAYGDLKIMRQLTCSLDNLEIQAEERLSFSVENAQLRFHCGEHVSATIYDKYVLLTHPGSVFKIFLNTGNAKVEKVRGLNSSCEIGGIAGQGFLQYEIIDTLIIYFQDEQRLIWSLTVY